MICKKDIEVKENEGKKKEVGYDFTHVLSSTLHYVYKLE